jgi:5-methylcytosine-specific restriction endonuclease McrA
VKRSSMPRRRSGIRRVSAKRAKENWQRRKIVDAVWIERPVCARPGCGQWADDVHEPLTRARGGSITDRDNMVPLCRGCHDEITFRPEKSELGWAYDLGLLVHSWDADRDREAGEAA